MSLFIEEAMFEKSQDKQQNNLPWRLRIIRFFNFTLHHKGNLTAVLCTCKFSLILNLCGGRLSFVEK